MTNLFRAILLVIPFLLNFFYLGRPSESFQRENDKADVLAFSYLGEEETKHIFEHLAVEDSTPIFLKKNYASYYFKNLYTNFGNNVFGTCSYISIGMLLSFYDSYWNESFISEPYEVTTEFESNRQYLADFDLIPSNVNSPGIRFEPGEMVDNLSIDQYYDLINSQFDNYFQFELIRIAMSMFGETKFDGSDSSLGMELSDISSLLSTYLTDYACISSNKVSVRTYSNSDDRLFREAIFEEINNGTPVILRAKESASDFGHTMIAYDYDKETDEIYVHTGWRDETNNITLTHVALSELPYDELLDITYIIIDDSFPHSHSYNYHSSMGDDMCSCSYIFPREIELKSGNFGDTLPTFEWMSLHKEKWYPANELLFDFSILDSNRNSQLSISRIDSNSYSLSQEEWDQIIFNIPGKLYNILIKIDNYSGLSGSDDVWCRTSFTKPRKYENVPYISPNEYGFADNYPSDEETATTFIEHNTHNGGSLQTRRFRTGSQNKKYIVLLPFGGEFDHAFIEYHFNKAVTRIDVELSHWLANSGKKLDSSIGKAEVQAYINGQWSCQLDLLADSTGLPNDRNNPNTFKIVFEKPTTNIRLYAEIYSTLTDEKNLGGICIGNLAFYEYDTLPLSGYELEYDPTIWQGLTMKNNCYGYALNNQVRPGTNDVWERQQPGEYSYTSHSPFTKKILKNAVTQDFLQYNGEFGTKLIFKEVGKYSVVPDGTYKVALVSFAKDYHWYRQDSDGYWSHKQGITPVKRTDYSGNMILDPETCDRGPYMNFLGFYAVTPWNNLYQN